MFVILNVAEGLLDHELDTEVVKRYVSLQQVSKQKTSRKKLFACCNLLCSLLTSVSND